MGGSDHSKAAGGPLILVMKKPQADGASAGVLASMLRRLRRIFALHLTPNAGEHGEQTAAQWLVRERGLEIIARNWRNPRDRRDEIDLVCLDGHVLVFVE